MNRVRMLLADDHSLVRAGLRMLINAIPDLEVVGEARTGFELLELAARHQPHLVVLDITMPGLNGLEATARLKITNPSTKVLILSMHKNDEYVRQALQHGANGYLLKDSAPVELELAIAAIMRGETFLSPAISHGVVGDYVKRLRSEQAAETLLSPRQRQILQLIAEGNSSKAIARLLDLSIKTVDTHRSQLMKQLDIHEVAGLVRYAIRTGVISPE